jgi:pimeloyl-ACP methyl ester carboxylesterase
MRRLGKAVRWCGMLLFVAIASGVLYGVAGQWVDAKLAPPASEMVTVDGRKVHVSCTGEGPRTFVLDAGLGGWSLFWGPIQQRLSAQGRVYSFDRSGLGWSETSSRGHDGVAAAEELRAIVRAAHIPTPFIYVGHSLGANFAQIYFARHPEDVAALVLLEPGRPGDLLEDFHGTRAQAMAAAERGPAYYVAGLMSVLGVTRLGGQMAPGRSFSDADRILYRAGLSRPSYSSTVAAQYAALPRTAYENMEVGGFGNVPVLLLNSSEPREPEGKETPEDVRRWRNGYLSYLASIAAKSGHGVGPIEIPNSTHKSLVLGQAQADLVVMEILKFVASVPSR